MPSASSPSSAYDEAAAVDYAVLTAGPGWNWSTLGRAVSRRRHLHESASSAGSVRTRQPNSSSGAVSRWRTITLLKGISTRQVLGFKKWSSLYLPTSSRRDSPSSTRRRPKSRASAASAAAQPGSGPAGGAPSSLARSPTRPAVAANQPAPEAPAPAQREVSNDQAKQPETPPPPPASLVGAWKAQASPDVWVSLTLEADGKFAWEVDTKGKKQALTGVAGFTDNTLALLQPDGPPLVGKVKQDGANEFVFSPDGAGSKAPGLTFTR